MATVKGVIPMATPDSNSETPLRRAYENSGYEVCTEGYILSILSSYTVEVLSFGCPCYKVSWLDCKGKVQTCQSFLFGLLVTLHTKYRKNIKRKVCGPT